MKNKVLIRLIVPELSNSYDIFIPVNEYIWRINKLIVNAVNQLSGNALDKTKEYVFINKNTGKIYQNNEIVINTEIRNYTELVLIKVR